MGWRERFRAFLRGAASAVDLWPAPSPGLDRPRGGFAADAEALARDWRAVGDDMRRAVARSAAEESLPPEAVRWLNDGSRRVPGLGDGDPREYGGRLPDGRTWVHPPYGPIEVRRPLFAAPRRRSRWRRLWSGDDRG